MNVKQPTSSSRQGSILELAFSDRANKVIMSSFNVGEIFEIFIAELGQYLDVDWAGIAMIEGDNLRFHALSSKIGYIWNNGDQIPAAETGTLRVMASKEPLLETNLLKDRKFWTGEQFVKHGIRSIIYIPLLDQGISFGSLTVASCRADAYDNDDTILLSHLTGKIAPNIRGAIQIKENQHQKDQSDSVGPLIRITGSNTIPCNIIQGLAEELKTKVDYDHLSLHLIEGEKVKPLATISKIQDDELDQETACQLDDSVTGWVKINRKSSIENDFNQEMNFPVDEIFFKHGLRSAIRVPLISHGEVFGSLNLISIKPNAYGAKEQQVLETLAAQIASPMESTVDFEEKQQTYSQDSAILELIQIGCQGLKKGKVFNVFSAKLKELVPFDEFSITFPNSNPEKPPSSAPDYTAQTFVASMEPGPAQNSEVGQTRSENASSDESDITLMKQFSSDAELSEQGYQAVLSVPLIHDDQPFGTINLASFAPRDFNETERQIAEQLSGVLSHIVWYEHVSTLEKEARLKLEEQDNARNLFINVLAHELKTPLTPILACTRMLAEESSREPGSTEDRMISNIIKGAQSLEARLNDLLDLAKFQVGSFSLNMDIVNIKKLIESTVAQLQPLTISKDQTLSLEVKDKLPVIEADGQRLEQVLRNLLGNAMKFTPRGGSIVLRAFTRGKDVLIEIEDTGPGVSPSEQERIFLPYHRREADRQRPGLGLGLALCKQLVEAHKGSIWVKSQDGQGSTFSFTIPLKKTSKKTSDEELVSDATTAGND